jgi:hypothetical protein
VPVAFSNASQRLWPRVAKSLDGSTKKLGRCEKKQVIGKRNLLS